MEEMAWTPMQIMETDLLQLQLSNLTPSMS